MPLLTSLSKSWKTTVTTSTAVLNAKHYGIPQNRERVYCVIIRKDLDNGKFKFPSPIPLKKALVDMLEDKVDERYYLPDDKVAAMITPPVQTNQ